MRTHDLQNDLDCFYKVRFEGQMHIKKVQLLVLGPNVELRLTLIWRISLNLDKSKL
jgi:hypothetical protein